MLRRKSENLENELLKLKFRQRQSAKDMYLIRSLSFDTIDTKTNTLASEIEAMKTQQHMYHKDTSLFKHPEA